MTVKTAKPVLPKKVEARIQETIADSFMLPTVAIQAIEITKDPHCLIGSFSNLVERDVKLASEILSIANSVVYSPARPIVSLHQAVVRLGFRQCRNLIVTTSLTSMKKKLPFEQEWAQETLWRHGFLTAMLSLNINRTLGLEFQGEEFTAGLIHDFGRTLIAAAFPEAFRQIDPLEFDESSTTLNHEREVLVTDHCEVGKWFAVANKLPPALIESVSNHHLPGQSPIEHRRLTTLTAISDHMANYLQRNGSPEGYDPTQNDSVILLEETGIVNAQARFDETWEIIMSSALKDAEQMMEL